MWGGIAYSCSGEGSKVDPAALEPLTQSAITEEKKTHTNLFDVQYGLVEDGIGLYELIKTVNTTDNNLARCYRQRRDPFVLRHVYQLATDVIGGAGLQLPNSGKPWRVFSRTVPIKRGVCHANMSLTRGFHMK